MLAGIEGADWGGLQRCQDAHTLGSAIIPAVCCVPCALASRGIFISHGAAPLLVASTTAAFRRHLLPA